MAKKRKNPFDDPFMGDGLYGAEENMEMTGIPGLNLSELAPLVAELTDQEGIMLFSMIGELVERGITPERYTSFYNAYQKLRPMFEPSASAGKRQVSKL